jgi:hypothetical protein
MKGNLIATVGLLSLGLAAFAAAPASAGEAWAHAGGGTGPNGGKWFASNKGHCHDDHCSSHQKVVGPNGGVVKRSGSTSCHGDTCSHTAKITGPDGASTSRNVTWKRN